MKFRLLHRKCALLARNLCVSVPAASPFAHAQHTGIPESWGSESQYFYRVLASRPSYIVGKTTSVAVKEVTGPLSTFLHAKPRNVTPSLLTEIVGEVPRLSLTDVYALLLHIAHLISQRQQKNLPGKERYGCLITALSTKAKALHKSHSSLEVDFTLADLFYRLGWLPTDLYEEMLQQQSRALKYLSKSDFIQHLFFSSSVRHLQKNTMVAVPIFIENVVEELDVEEVALICLSLFRCQYNTLDGSCGLRLVDALEKHEGDIHDIVVCVFAKYVRYLAPPKKTDFSHVKKFLDVISKRQQERSLYAQLRIANVGTQAGICEPNVLRSATSQVIKQIDTCRIKDIATCLFTNAFFDVKISAQDAEMIIERLRNLSVPKKFHMWLIRATMALATMGYFDECLVRRSLDRNVIDFTTTHNNCKIDTYALWTTCKLMLPHVTDELGLSVEDFQSVREKILSVTDCSKARKVQLDQLQSLLEKKLLLRTELVQTLDSFSQKDIHVENKLVLVCHPPHYYSTDDQLLGMKKFRVKLLRAAGYNVVEIHQDFFSTFSDRQQAEKLRELTSRYL